MGSPPHKPPTTFSGTAIISNTVNQPLASTGPPSNQGTFRNRSASSLLSLRILYFPRESLFPPHHPPLISSFPPAATQCTIPTCPNRRQHAPPHPPPSGSRSFGEYDLLDILGRGGMGIVYRSWQPALQRSVALKLLLAGPSASPVFNRRFRGEAPAAARLRHHGIITVFDLGDTDGQPYHTMELIEGSTLTDSLRSGLPSPPRRNASTSPPSPISGSPPHGPATHPSLTPRHEASPAPPAPIAGTASSSTSAPPSA